MKEGGRNIDVWVMWCEKDPTGYYWLLTWKEAMNQGMLLASRTMITFVVSSLWEFLTAAIRNKYRRFHLREEINSLISTAREYLFSQRTFPSLPSPKLCITKHNTSQLSILEKWSEIHSNWCCILWLCVFKSHNILWAPKGPQRRRSGPFSVIKLIYKWRHPGHKALGSTMLQVAQVTSEPVQVLSQANSLPIPYATSN